VVQTVLYHDRIFVGPLSVIRQSAETTIHTPAPKVRRGGIASVKASLLAQGSSHRQVFPDKPSSDMFRVRSPITAAAPHGICTRFLIKRPAKGVPSLLFSCKDPIL
jgi:hypothetical protein